MTPIETVDERIEMCLDHPDEPVEWPDGMCQTCWEEFCAAGWWEMLTLIGGEEVT